MAHIGMENKFEISISSGLHRGRILELYRDKGKYHGQYYIIGVIWGYNVELIQE